VKYLREFFSPAANWRYVRTHAPLVVIAATIVFLVRMGWL